jgi:hypothetical protein
MADFNGTAPEKKPAARYFVTTPDNPTEEVSLM